MLNTSKNITSKWIWRVVLVFRIPQKKLSLPVLLFFLAKTKNVFEAFACEIKTPFMKDTCIPQPKIPLTWSDGIVKTTCVHWRFFTL